MATEAIGVVDIGASGGRFSTLARDAGGYRLETIHEFSHVLHEIRQTDAAGAVHRRLYWNPPHIHEGIIQGLRRFAARGAGTLVGLGIDSWGSDGVWASESGDLLFPASSCHCERFRETCQEVERRMPGRERFTLTGVYPDDFLVVNQVYWAARSRPDMVGEAKAFLPLAALYAYWLSGVMAMEYTWGTTGHLASCLTGGYCREIFDRLELPLDKMPEFRQTGGELGPCHAGLADDLGLKRFKIMLPPTHDTASAFAAAPVAVDGAALVVSAGTWWCMGTPLSRPIVTDAAYNAHFSNVGGAEGVVLNVINMGSLPLQALKRQWEHEDGAAMAWEDVNRLAGPELRDGMAFDIDDARLRNTPDMAASVAEIAGLAKSGAARGKLAALVYTGLARKAAEVAKALSRVGGKPAEEIVVIGGGARNDLMNQRIADVSGLPVRTGPANATTLGNALVQAVALGWFSSLDEGRKALAGLWREKTYTPSRR